MIRELRLIPRGGDDMILVEWNDETGTIEGDGAEYVAARIDRYVPGEQIPCMPECSGYTLSAEPRKSLADMAAILHEHFRIPDWLMEHYPEPDEDESGDEWPGSENLPITPVEH